MMKRQNKLIDICLEEIHRTLVFPTDFKSDKKSKYVWWYESVFLVCSISAGRYTGTIIEQVTQQAVKCDT